MLDIAHLFVGTAWAQGTPPAAAPVTVSASPLANLSQYLPIVLIFLVFYVLILRPQQKKLAEQDKMIKALQRGDRVITSSGIHGKISKIDDTHIMVEVADDVHIKLERSHVQGLAAKTGTAAVASDGTEDRKL